MPYVNVLADSRVVEVPIVRLWKVDLGSKGSARLRCSVDDGVTYHTVYKVLVNGHGSKHKGLPDNLGLCLNPDGTIDC